MTSEQSVVFTLPGVEDVRVRKDVRYGGGELTADVYSPSTTTGARPAVIFISGDAPPEFMHHLKDSAQYTAWGRLAAATGLVGVTFDHSSTLGLRNAAAVASEVDELRSFVRANAADLGIDPGRLGIWTCSAGPPFGLRSVLRDGDPGVRCIAIYYGALDMRPLRARIPPEVSDAILEDFSPTHHLRATAPPLLLARAGRDAPEFNEAMDGFLRRALELNLQVDHYNHALGQHAFDIRDDDPRSREIIAATLAFFSRHLESRPPG
jgi:dienelactone hydrolase